MNTVASLPDPVVAECPTVINGKRDAPCQENWCPKPGWCPVHRTMPATLSLRGIDLDVTEACNLACTYCFKWQKKAVHMDEATAKNAIDWLLEASGGNRGELKVNLMGGEPLLRFDLIRKIVPYGKCRARQRGRRLHFGCTTNCTVLTDEMLNFWRRYGMGFHCSIDGIPEVQNTNRPLLSGGPSSAAVEKNAPKILSYRPEVMARATITPRAVRCLLDSAKYLLGLGFHSITFKPAVNCGWQPDDFEALRSQFEKLGEFYIDRLTSGKPFKFEDFDLGIQTIHLKSMSAVSCGAGCGLVLIDPRGDIWPCHRFGPHQCGGQFHLGRIGGAFNDRLRDVFLRARLQEDLRADCKACRARLTCTSWCTAECVDATHDFYKPAEDFCQIMKIRNDQMIYTHNYLRSHHPDVLSRILSEDP